MGLFDQWGYTNFHELNLDWVLQALKELEHTIEQFIAINALKYADPIQWNIVSQYEKNTIVIDPQTGTAYISVQPVPSGVALTNTDYWTVVFDLGSFVVRASKNFATKYEDTTTLTATFPSSINDWLIWGDVLYKVISPIVAGDQYVIDSNIQHFTIEELTGHLEDLNTTDKSNIVDAINEVLQTLIDIVGDLDDLTTIDKTSIVNAINSVAPIPVLDVTKHGVNTSNADNSAALQTCIDTYASDYEIYVPNGVYHFTNSITLPDYVRFKCDGTLIFSTASGAGIYAAGYDQIVSIANIESDHDAIELIATTKTIGRSIYTLPRIWAHNGDALILHANGTNGSVGVQKCDFTLNSIKAGRYGILLYAESSTYSDWINENNFYNPWIGADTSAIKFIKGTNQTDKYNHNRFINFSTENSVQALNIDYAAHNVFENLRTLEIMGLGNQIEFTSDTENNIISSASQLYSSDIIDAGIDNFYDLMLLSDNAPNHVIANKFTCRWSDKIPLVNNGFAVDRTVELNNANVSLSNNDTTNVIVNITDGGTHALNLSLASAYVVYWKPIFVHISSNNGTLNIYGYNGTLLASESDTGVGYIILGGLSDNQNVAYRFQEFVPNPNYVDTVLTANTANIDSPNSVTLSVAKSGSFILNKWININGSLLNFGQIATGTIPVNASVDYPIMIDGKLYMITISPTDVSISDPLSNGIPGWDISRVSFM